MYHIESLFEAHWEAQPGPPGTTKWKVQIKPGSTQIKCQTIMTTRGRMRFLKRKRALYKPYYSGGRSRLRATRARQARRRAGRSPFAGFTRTAGYYGRFTGPGAPELKFYDIDINDADIAVNGTIQTPGLAGTASCNTIAQGVTEVTRIGRKCTIKSINWRWNITFAGSADTATGKETVRLILYLDKQANGAAATVAGILESDDYQSFNNLANKSRFRTLMDRTYDIGANGGAGNGTANDTVASEINDSLYKRVTIPIEFDSTTGALTEVRSNNIGVLILSKNGSLCVFDSKMRLRFSDNQ